MCSSSIMVDHDATARMFLINARAAFGHTPKNYFQGQNYLSNNHDNIHFWNVIDLFVVRFPIQNHVYNLGRSAKVRFLVECKFGEERPLCRGATVVYRWKNVSSHSSSSEMLQDATTKVRHSQIYVKANYTLSFVILIFLKL